MAPRQHAIGGGEGRRHDLDWVRSLAILSVLWYHAAQLFTGQLAGFEAATVAPTAAGAALGEFCFFFHQWRMPLVFCVAGVGCAAALERRGAQTFAADRVRRLAVPLAFGLVTVLPAQLYLIDGGPVGLEAYAVGLRSALAGEPVPRLGHLWFIASLLLADAAVVPALILLRGAAARRWHARGDRPAAGPERALAGVLAVALVVAAVRCLPTRYVGQWTVLGVAEFKPFVYHLAFYVAGVALAASRPAWTAMERRRRALLAAALVMQAAVYLLRDAVAGGAGPGTARLMDVLSGATAWLWVATVLGYGRAHLGFENPLLRYAREASYPVYLLHYPLLLALATPIALWDAPVWLRFPALGALVTAAAVGIYHAAVRPFAAARFVFGLRPLPAAGGSALHRDVRDLVPRLAPAGERARRVAA